MFTKLIALILAIGSVTVYAVPLQNPQWYKTTLDSKRAERFIAIADYKGTPVVSYFDSPSEGGLLMQKATTGNSGLLDSLLFYTNGKRDWTEGALDPTKYTGRFVSTVSDGKNIYATYQESEVGREKLMYAQYDGKTWTREVVDDVSNGANIGLFPSISLLNDPGSSSGSNDPGSKKNPIPVIFYHTEQGLKFGYAIRKQASAKDTSEVTQRGSSDGGGTKSDNWDRKTLETGVGWLTTSASCSDPGSNLVYVAYRGRNDDNIYLGILENQNSNIKDQNQNSNLKDNNARPVPNGTGEAIKQCNNGLCWSSKKLPIKTSTGLAIIVRDQNSNIKDQNQNSKIKTIEEVFAADSPITNSQLPITGSCSPLLAYSDEADNRVKLLDINSNKTTVMGDSEDSRISLASSPDALYALYQGPKGLVLAKSQNNRDWTEEIIDSEKTAGSYNALAVDENNNISLAYISGTSVKYAEYNTTALVAAKRTQKVTSVMLLVLGAAILTSKIIKRKLSVTGMKTKKGKRK